MRLAIKVIPKVFSGIEVRVLYKSFQFFLAILAHHVFLQLAL